MLVANSFIVNAIGSVSADGGLSIWFAAAGIVLCGIWAMFIWDGWGWFYQFMKEGHDLPVDSRLNPFARIPKIGIRGEDRMFRMALAVPCVFVVIYTVAIWYLLAGKT
jgi:hypothetical protein